MNNIYNNLCALTLILLSCLAAPTAIASTESLIWHLDMPSIPAPLGEKIQHGLAGAYSGVLKSKDNHGNISEHLIIAGGANFSKQGLVASLTNDVAPEKIYHRDIFILNKQHNEYIWQQASIQLPLGAAYGQSFNTDKGMMLFGGEVKQADGSVNQSNNVALITFENGRVAYKKIGNMPVSFIKGGGAYFQGKVYLIGGVQNGKLSNEVHIYDVNSGTWQLGPAYPGPARSQSVVTIHQGAAGNTKLFLYSGFAIVNNKNIALTDGYVVDLTRSLNSKAAQWQQAPSIQTKDDGKPISLLGAASINVSSSQTLFFGGYNKHTWDNWLNSYQKVQGTAEEKFVKIKFFSQSPEQFNWNKQALLFNSLTNTWQSLGDAPFLPNCGAAIQRLNNDIILINGEIKPGVRTPTIKRVSFNHSSNNTRILK